MSETIINRRQIHWFPGHMAKTLRLMETEIRHVDCVLQVLDARIPLSSLNPEIERITAGKPHLYVLNKADLADPAITRQWLEYFRSAGEGCLPMDSKQKGRANAVRAPIEQELAALMERRRAKGMVGARIRVMVVGIPNVGKSTFINSFAGKACTKTGNRPGVTKGKQWIRLNKELELLDTPGILWPKFEDQQVGMHLAFIGSMNDEIIVMEELALSLIEFLQRFYPDSLTERYACEGGLTPVQVLEAAAKRRGCIKKGGEADLSRASALIMEDFRAGRLGRISLERPETVEKKLTEEGETK